MTEPQVTLTDYMLTFLCTVFAVILYKRAKQLSFISMTWLLFFISAAIAAFFGGTVHGFYSDPHAIAYKILWTGTLIMIGLTATCCWVIGGYYLNKNVSKWIIFASLMLIIYLLAVLFYTQNFLIAIIDYLPAIVFLFLVMTYLFLKTKIKNYFWVMIGIIISLIAAFIQQTNFSVHPIYFDHNSTYHLVQAFGFWFVFLGAKGLLHLKEV